MNKNSKYCNHVTMTTGEKVIANELAEMNRLKRIELEILWSIQKDEWKKGSYKTLDRILEDQA